MEFNKFTIITGHYGCGKTNLSLNIALDLASRGEKVSLVDLDIVNPYFRSSDYRETVEKAGVRLIAPGYAGSTLDSPALPAEIYSIFETDGYVIIDVGGDDVGATALGRFSAKIREKDYDMLYVINKYRPITSEAEGAAELLGEIEFSSHLKAKAIVNNSHLMNLTTEETVRSALPYAEESSKKLGLPVRFTTAPEALAPALKDVKDLYPIKTIVKTVWM